MDFVELFFFLGSSMKIKVKNVASKDRLAATNAGMKCPWNAPNRNPPRAGPSTKPTPNDMPMTAMPFALFSGVVTSLM